MTDFEYLIDEKRIWLTEYVAKTRAWNNSDDNWKAYVEEASDIVDDFIKNNLVCVDKLEQKQVD